MGFYAWTVIQLFNYFDVHHMLQACFRDFTR